MGASLDVFAVSVERLKRIIGSKDESALDTILETTSDWLDNIDSLIDDDDDDEVELTAAEALAHLVRGEEPNDNDPSFLYGYAFQAICWQVGQELANICPIARASRWITEDVDPAMEIAGIPIRLSDLVFRGSPVAMPPVDDPSIGFWRAEEVQHALTAFRALDLSTVSNDMADTFTQMREWLEEAEKLPGVSLIGFLA